MKHYGRLLLVYSTQPTQRRLPPATRTLLAPAFVATDRDLEELVDRMAATVKTVEAQVKAQMVGAAR